MWWNGNLDVLYNSTALKLAIFSNNFPSQDRSCCDRKTSLFPLSLVDWQEAEFFPFNYFLKMGRNKINFNLTSVLGKIYLQGLVHITPIMGDLPWSLKKILTVFFGAMNSLDKFFFLSYFQAWPSCQLTNTALKPKTHCPLLTTRHFLVNSA